MIQEKIYRYFEQNPGLKILFVFDPLCSIRAELDEQEWKPGFRYVVFDGSWFKTKYLLENEWVEDNVPVL